MEIIGLQKYYSAFFRDLVYEVRHEPTSHPVKTLLLHRLPNGVYMDQYQLADLKEEMGLQVIMVYNLFLICQSAETINPMFMNFLSVAVFYSVTASDTHEPIDKVCGAMITYLRCVQTWNTAKQGTLLGSFAL